MNVAYISDDLILLVEFKDAVGPIAAGLDMLQGKEKAYMELLLPTLVGIFHCLKIKVQSNFLVYSNSMIEYMIFELEKGNKRKQ